MILPALLAKLLSAGAVAQAATGAGVALVVVAGAGTAGVLPDPLQNTVATAVETVTPFDISGGEETEPVEEPVAEEIVTDEPVSEVPPVDDVPAADVAFDAATWEEAGPDAYPSFGAWVSAGSKHDVAAALGVRFGELVSARARAKGMDAEDLTAEGVDVDALDLDGADLQDPAGTTTAPAPGVSTPTPAAGPTAATQRGSDRSSKPAGGAGGGNGNGQGNGQGNGRN